MKNSNLKAFTLVEMLIVIVIIGILIAALLPRMSAAQGRARDVARKTALSQIQSAIVTYQGDMWKWPRSCDVNPNSENTATSLKSIEKELINAGMTDLPSDPLAWNNVNNLWGLNDSSASWNYIYMVSKRNWTNNAWFILMAKSEVAWWSNWVVCSGAAEKAWSVTTWDSGWYIWKGADLKDVHPCPSVEETWECKNPNDGVEKCTVKDSWELRYIVLY